MQLPRGTFREIRKKVTIGSLLSELEQTRFTGTCSIFSGPATGTFVFREGTCILARFRGTPGNAGWDEMQASAGEVFDVILSTLDEAQIKLSLEFNPACKMVKAGSITPHDRTPADQKTVKTTIAVRQAAPPGAPVKSHPGRVVITSGPPFSTTPHQAPPAQAALQIPVKQGEKRETVPEDELPPSVPDMDSIESDFDALDSMDLEHVTSRIRSDCKALIKELRLEHLMER